MKKNQILLFTTLRLFLKKIFDQIKNERLKTNLLQAIPFWAASALTGLMAVTYAKLFSYAEKGTSFVFQHHGPWLLILSPICFVLAWWVVDKYAPNARGSGIPQAMAAIELANPKNNHKIGRLLSIRIIVVKIISSLTMVLGGGIIGREGPTIQIAGSVFRKVNELLPDWWPKISKRNMIMTGAAAGLAAAFNTPLGGIVFAIEELSKTHISYFKTALFTAVLIAGLTAQGLLGPYLYLGYPDIHVLSSWIFGAVILVAMVSGIMGSLMSKFILRIFKWRSSFKKQSQYILFAVLCSLFIVSAALYLNNEYLLGSGKSMMATTLFTSNKILPWYTPILRIAGSMLSFTVGAAGGIFAPALSAGASIGAVFSGWFHLTPSNTNLIILCGMVGFLTGVTRTPFTSAILVLEMTDRHNVIFHLMLAGLAASLIAMTIDRHSLYDHLKYQYLSQVEKEEINPVSLAEKTETSLESKLADSKQSLAIKTEETPH